MKFLIFALVVAFMANSAMGFRRGGTPFSRARVDIKRMLYAAGGTVQCDLCEMVVGDIQSALKGQESEIENLFDSLCDELPQEYQANCTALINEYLPILFTLIDDMSPQEVCELLTLCQSEVDQFPSPAFSGKDSLTGVFNRYIAQLSRSSALKERRINFMRSLVQDDYLCHACEDTVHYMHDTLADDELWEEIGEYLLPFCQFCPEQYRGECQSFFQDLPEYIRELADEYLNPEEVCERCGFCTPGEATTPELSTEGPEEEEVPEIDMIPIEPRVQRINVGRDNRIYDMSRLSKKNKMKKLGKTGKHMNQMGIRGMDRMRKPRSIIVHVAGNTANQIPYAVPGNTVPDQKKCEICRYFSSAAEGVVQNNEENIKNGLTTIFEDLCEAVPDQFKDECTSEITDVLPGVIYQMLLKVFDQDYLCTQTIGICQ